MRYVLRLMFAGLLLLLPSGLLWGQASTGTGTITGQVTDASGAVVPGATVTITDTSTKISKTDTSNKVGRYVFVDMAPGAYNVRVEKQGFRQSEVAGQQLLVGQALTVNVSLEVGAATQTVEVSATPGAELQTLNSTMGTTVSGDILSLPSINRDVTNLTQFTATAQPTFHAEGNITAGGIAGQTSDQNAILLDGGNATDDLAGNNGYVNGQSGTVNAVIPTPAESIQEFQVNTNNFTADFNTAAGGQILLATKRGTNQWHGSGYDYLQSSVLDSDDWNNNFLGLTKPKTHSNRFGGSVGGPMLPSFLGGKTYFYFNYEGNRVPESAPITRIVPSTLLRQGIVQERDASGAPVPYNLATSTQCGTAGGQACDPRGIGLAPDISKLWSTYEPMPNDCEGAGDHLNTCGFVSNVSTPITDNFAVGRIDHDFGAKWRLTTSYRYYKETAATTNQIDIGGLLPGDKLGQAASASSNVLLPSYFVAGLTGTITPTLTNNFHFNYTRNDWVWIRAGALPQLSGIPGALEIGGESTSALIPLNIDTQDARRRLWQGHDWDYRDTVSWFKGSHFFQMGGEGVHQWLHFDRYDNVVGGLTQLGYEINNSGVNFSPQYQPVPCPTGSTSATNCLPSSEIGSWNSLYSQVTGILDAASIVATRTGANLSLNPLGTPVSSYDIVDRYSLYFSDAWKVKSNLTLSYGLNWGVEMPPYALNGEQDIQVDQNGLLNNTENYLANVMNAAVNGQTYTPTLGWSPIADLNRKYPYNPYYGEFAPRVSLAWSPNPSGGWMDRLFGHKTTVLRGGYARIYDRTLPINYISGTVLGDGFLQSVSCTNPNSSSACTTPGVVNPTNAFRIGVDGNSVPLTIAPTLQSPVEPGVNAPYATLAEALDPNFRPASTDQIDFSIQRQLPGNSILEVGYVGVWAKHLYQGLDLDNVPWFMKLNGQTFAQAYDNLYSALSAGKTPAAQPFLESALGGSSYCSGFSNCTAAVAANESGNVLGQYVTNMWSDLDSHWNFGSTLLSDSQCFYCYTNTADGYSNYQALVISYQKRTAKGLTLNSNFTYGHALGTVGLAQTYTLANLTDPFNPRVDYGPQYYDRKFTFNLLGTYQLPFGPGQRWASSNGVVKRLIGGWALSPIFSAGSGLPLPVYDGSFQEWGQGEDGNGVNAVSLANTRNFSNSAHLGVTSNGSVGVNGDGFTNANLFGSNAAQVYSDFRPNLVGIDGRSMGTGQLRGQSRWNLDLGLTKDTRITERVGAQIYVQAFNVLNHMAWSDPYNALNDPADFGALEGQYNALAPAPGGTGQYTRVIDAGLRVSF